MKIGVVSDTHGVLYRRVKELFEGVDLILHAGDVGNLNVLYELFSIAPTEAVWGNMDPLAVREETDERLIIYEKGIAIGVAHGGGSPLDIIDRLWVMFEQDDVDIIVFGHTHRPFAEKINDTFYFNPGSGKETVGFIEIEDDGTFRTKIVEL